MIFIFNCHQWQWFTSSISIYRSEVINWQSHALDIQIADNLTSYMATIRAGGEFCPDGRYIHTAKVSERLNFLRYLLRDGQMWLCAPKAKRCVAEDALFSSDREICFKWFSKLNGDERDLDPEINRDFIESNLLKPDPAPLTNLGPRLLSQQVEIHEVFIGSCRDYIKEKGGGKVGVRSRMEVDALLRLCRVCALHPLTSSSEKRSTRRSAAASRSSHR